MRQSCEKNRCKTLLAGDLFKYCIMINRFLQNPHRLDDGEPGLRRQFLLNWEIRRRQLPFKKAEQSGKKAVTRQDHPIERLYLAGE
jgi:hypothetical protein